MTVVVLRHDDRYLVLHRGPDRVFDRLDVVDSTRRVLPELIAEERAGPDARGGYRAGVEVWDPGGAFSHLTWA